MEQVSSYADKRQMMSCVYCGNPPDSRDHVPSRVLLDEPYPENLPVLPACRLCNDSHSKDEEYVACLVECVISGSVRPERVGRQKIARILTERPAIAARLGEARIELNGVTRFHVEMDRVTRVMLKLARGHAAFELNDPQIGQPRDITIKPLPNMAEDAEPFEAEPELSIWPEVGSRAMVRLVEGRGPAARWIVVQPGRYRYIAAVGQKGVLVRLVLSEYLSCKVLWD